MATVNLKTIDGTVMLPLPLEALEMLSLQDGSSVNITISNDGIFIQSRERRIPKFNLDELLAEHAQLPAHIREDREWIDAPRVGRELI